MQRQPAPEPPAVQQSAFRTKLDVSSLDSPSPSPRVRPSKKYSSSPPEMREQVVHRRPSFRRRAGYALTDLESEPCQAAPTGSAPVSTGGRRSYEEDHCMPAPTRCCADTSAGHRHVAMSIAATTSGSRQAIPPPDGAAPHTCGRCAWAGSYTGEQRRRTSDKSRLGGSRATGCHPRRRSSARTEAATGSAGEALVGESNPTA